MKTVKLLSITLAPILSGALLVLPFPRYDVSWLVWVGLVPLLMAISGRSVRLGFFSSYVCGVVFFCGVFSWAFAIPGYKLVHQAMLAFYASFYFAFFGLIFTHIAKRSSVTYAHLAAPFIWTGLEYMRSNFAFLALPWPLLAHSQYQHPLIIQFAAITGAYGVSFLIVLVNSAIAAMLLPLTFRPGQNRLTDNQMITNKGRNVLAGLAAILVALALLYGSVALSEPLSGKKIKLSVLQGNIDKAKKDTALNHDRHILQRYSELTRQASGDKPALIVWPEAATPGFILRNMTAFSKIMSIVREVKIPFLIGSSEFSKFAKDPAVFGKNGNTAVFISPEGKVLGQYLKIRLLPFAEYLPYEGAFEWPDWVIPKKSRNWEHPGKEFTLFNLDGARFGTIICWENAFPDLFRQFVKNGANFMLNITNEGWFGETAAPYQFLAMCVFRSVENRISMARAANTGISCFIDPYGRITGRVWNNNKDIFVDGYLTREIQLSEQKTFYTNYGEIFVYLTLAMSALFIGLSFLKVK
jgi:apolipoprotein N-acyltransferase